MTKQIKRNALEAFTNKDYAKAFTTLWELGAEDFIQYSQKENRKPKKGNWLSSKSRICKKCIESSTFFWNTFILQEDVFRACFSSERPVELLHNYYSKTDFFNRELETRLAKEYPQVFIEAIRKNEVFFKEDRINFLLEDNLLITDEYKNHKEAWKLFYNNELYYWNEIQKQFELIRKHPLNEILYTLIIVLDTERLKVEIESEEQFLGNAYSFFVELLFSDKNIDTLNNSREIFDVGFINYFFKQKEELNTYIQSAIRLILERETLFSTYIDPYSFEKGSEIKISNGDLSIVNTREANIKWHQDGKRYVFNEVYYFQRGEKLVNELISEGKITIPGKNKFEINANKELAYKQNAIRLGLEDLGISDFYNYNKPIEKVGRIIPPIQTLAFNKLVRYKRAIKKSFFFNSSFSKKYLYYLKSKPKFLQLPFFFISKEDYQKLNIKANSSFNKENTTGILKIFSTQINNKSFNRFNTSYDVFSKPFLEIENHLFCPTFCLASFSGIYVYLDNLLKNNGRHTAINIEEILENYLTSTKWNIKRLKNNDADKIQGDADLIISDENLVLLIQLKRTKLRLNPKEVYHENLLINSKAIKQLNEAEISFTKENSVFNLDNRKVKKWIISTSFENVNETVDGCLKVNYFELLHFFDMMKNEGLMINSLQDFIKLIEKDHFFKTNNKFTQHID